MRLVLKLNPNTGVGTQSQQPTQHANAHAALQQILFWHLSFTEHNAVENEVDEQD